MSTDIESISWYLTDLNVDEGDYLAGLVVTAMMVLEHLDLPEYFSRFSNRIFGDRWKFGLLVLKEYLDVSYEDLVRMLPSFRGVLDAGGAPRIPHKDTLRKFSGRLPEGLLDRVIGETARLMCGPDILMAVDSTGFSESNASRHFVKRLKYFGNENTVVRDFAKATFAVDTGSLVIVSCDVTDSHHADIKRFAPVLALAKDTGVNVSKIVADKGYDSEQAHVDARGILGACVETVIPTRELEPKSGKLAWECLPKGWFRKIMARDLDKAAYALRCLVETVNSMVKRKMGDVVYGKTLASMAREIKFACIAHNTRLLIDSGLVRI